MQELQALLALFADAMMWKVLLAVLALASSGIALGKDTWANTANGHIWLWRHLTSSGRIALVLITLTAFCAIMVEWTSRVADEQAFSQHQQALIHLQNANADLSVNLDTQTKIEMYSRLRDDLRALFDAIMTAGMYAQSSLIHHREFLEYRALSYSDLPSRFEIESLNDALHRSADLVVDIDGSAEAKAMKMGATIKAQQAVDLYDQKRRQLDEAMRLVHAHCELDELTNEFAMPKDFWSSYGNKITRAIDWTPLFDKAGQLLGFGRACDAQIRTLRESLTNWNYRDSGPIIVIEGN